MLGDALADELGAVMAWVNAQAATPIDPEHGPTWALAYAPLTGGGSVLSFVTSHVVADGSLKLVALEAAPPGTACRRCRATSPRGGP